jgi:predicted HNH restriction endonuclease
MIKGNKIARGQKKGFRHSEETKRQISLSSKGKNNWSKDRKLTEEHKKKISSSLKGIIFSEERKKNISDALAGKHLSEETKEKLRMINLGRKVSEDTIIKMRDSMKKANKEGRLRTLFRRGMIPWSYIDGRSKTRRPNRYNDDWEKIRVLVWRRDNYECQHCGINMSECYQKFKCALHTHHIIPFLTSFDNSLNNLIALCPSCHRKEEVKITKELKLQMVEA